LDELQTRYELSYFSMGYRDELRICYKKGSTIDSGENCRSNILIFQWFR